MISELNQTPKAMRLHIGVFGATNAGKSTLINAVSGQEIALTSPVAGTTTDPVFKPMELLPLGAIVLIDTAGLDDTSELGALRIKKSLAQLETCDGAIYVISSKTKDIDEEIKCINAIKEKKIPVLVVINEIDDDKSNIEINDFPYIKGNLNEKSTATIVKKALIELLEDKVDEVPLTGDLVKKGDVVLLIAPQDIQAPKGRLILPQVQIIRDLLDNECMVMTVTTQNIEASLKALAVKPSLVITDSQIFKKVSELIPSDIRLTSFSMLMAKNKADIIRLIQGARAIDNLQDDDSVVILESCSHHALDGDIARIKIPNLLRKYTGKNIIIENISGQKVPDNISKYKLAIHCGGCMVNRKAMVSKQDLFEKQGIPMTNFGVAIAYMNGIIDRVCY